MDWITTIILGGVAGYIVERLMKANMAIADACLLTNIYRAVMAQR